MGNETSHVREFCVSKESFGTAFEWVLFEGRKNITDKGQDTNGKASVGVLDAIDGNVVTVFVGMSEGKLGCRGFLHNAVKTLMTLRHPDVLRFLLWRESSTRLELVTEPVRPLPELTAHLTELDISGGLLAVLRAAEFLHQQAGLCHNNISQSAVFVSAAGGWRLGGMEFACRFSEVTAELLERSRGHRYPPAVAPEERQTDLAKQPWFKARPWCRDVFSYGVLADELIGNCVKNDFPGARQFQLEVQRRLCASDPLSRPALTDLQHHMFFSNDFNQIQQFLETLVVRSPEQHRTFFTELAERLRAYPEELVASKLSTLCLSRLVLLNSHACQHFLPRLLVPRTDQYISGECIFSPAIYRRHIVPQLLRIFHVRDAHIRLILLRHFPGYVAEIPKHLLAEVVLPQLLLGVRDTHDELVAATLRALAELVPLLGARVVVGTHRQKLFGHGTPKEVPRGPAPVGRQKKHVTIAEPQPDTTEEGRRLTLLELARRAEGDAAPLPERSPPEGGEELSDDHQLSDDQLPQQDSDGDWSDWEAAEPARSPSPPVTSAPGGSGMKLSTKGDSASSVGGMRLITTKDSAVSSTSLKITTGGDSNLSTGGMKLTTREDSAGSATSLKLTTGGDSGPSLGGMKLTTKRDGALKPSRGGASASGGGGRKQAAVPAGGEFERYSIQVARVPAEEVDLFADMQPVIRSARLAPARPGADADAAPAAQLSFQLQDPDTVGEAWGEDWGEL